LLTKTEIDVARKRGKALANIEPRAASAWLDILSDCLGVELTSGVKLFFPINKIDCLDRLSLDELLIADFEITPSGYGVHSECLNIDLAVPALVASILTPDFIIAESARIRGRIRSAATIKAAQENGRLGGRPKKLQGRNHDI
jgi:hypothetical protein